MKIGKRIVDNEQITKNKRKWHFLTLLIVTCSLLIVPGCNNFFHDLIPPDGDRITSFIVEGQIDNAIITDNTITVMVEKGTNIHALIPRIEISKGASIIPITLDYIKAAFPGADLMKEAMALYTTTDLPGYVRELIRQNPDFNVPAIDISIDFSPPVSFFVISGQGSMREYIVRVTEDTRRPQIYAMRFAKYDNPELVIDALCVINESAKTITAQALYPVEMPYLSYALVPSFDILGERLEFDGVPVESGIDDVQFSAGLDTPQTATVTVKRGVDESVDYTLTIVFTEDPDSVRSITDFRFTKADNSLIAANAVATIINTGSTGTINVTVFYSGAEPSWLIPRFVSPGTVSVGGATQTTGVTGQDYSSPLEYRVVSRNGQYTRTYTVTVTFVSLSADAPRITSFGFSHALNPDLVQDTTATINHDAGLIIIDAYYGGPSAPETLVPEFTAEGLVKVFGSVQLSGASAQDFRRELRYTVTNPENSLLMREYRVQTRLARDTSSDASITAFGFYPLDNPGLADALTAKIDQATGKISLYAPVGSGVTQREMVPRFTAAGTVSVNDAPQISGLTGQTFDAPLIYTVKSANGINTRDYTVDVRELMSTIYVKHDAHGQNDGTNWTDAFISLQAACEAALQFPEDVPKELWIAAGTYKPSTSGNSEEYFPLTANTSYIGGFAGGETSKSERNVAANKVIISGDLGGGVYSYNLFGAFNGNTALAVNGDVSFDGVEFTLARAVGSGGRANGAALNAMLETGSEMSVRNCSFSDLQAPNGSMVHSNGGKLAITGTSVNNITARYGIYGYNLSGVEISDLPLQDIGYGLYFTNCSGNIEINSIDLRNISSNGFYFLNCSADIELNSVILHSISGNGIYITGGSGKKELSGITGNNISGSYGVYVNTSGSSIQISEAELRNVSGSNGIYASGGNIVIEGVSVENVPNGRGMYIDTNATAQILGCTIKDTKSTGNGGGIYLTGTGSAEIYDTLIEDVEATHGGGIYTVISQLTISHSIITNAKAPIGGGVCVRDSNATLILISGEILNNTAPQAGGGVYMMGGTFIMEGGKISGNTTPNYGGGVDLSNGTFVMNGGEISNNTAAPNDSSMSYGGGVYVSSGTFIMNGGTISGNTVGYNGSWSGTGGGVFVYSNGTFTMKNGEILGNTAYSVGGGLGVQGTFTKTGGTIYGYSAGDLNNSNVAKDSSGTVRSNSGHAVYVYVQSSPAERRETTAGPAVNLDSSVAGAAGGWE